MLSLSRNHTFFLFIKNFLLVTSIILGLLPLAWNFLAIYVSSLFVSQFVGSIGDYPMNLGFENLTLKTLQKKERMISLTTPFARIHDFEISKISLSEPTIQVDEKGKRKITLKAQSGLYQSVNNHILLTDKVSLTSNQIYNIKTSKLLIDLNKIVLTMPEGIHAKYENNSLKAKNVIFFQKSNKAIFKGNVKVIIQPNMS